MAASGRTTQSRRPSRSRTSRQFVLGDLVGRGSTCEVRLFRYAAAVASSSSSQAGRTPTGAALCERHCAKIIALDSTSADHRAYAEREARLCRVLPPHPNVVRFFDDFTLDGKLYVVMQYCEGGDLYSYIRAKALEESEIGDCSGSLFPLQSSSATLALREDFRPVSDLAQTAIGTPNYMSPEVAAGRPYSWKSDVWAIGFVVAHRLFVVFFSFFIFTD
ncbi:kinase-like domain-containing protein [Zopfochytrium polystomum]|nr:kinase-like domain-containing protein [Zopfochytrium polystomum]